MESFLKAFPTEKMRAFLQLNEVFKFLRINLDIILNVISILNIIWDFFITNLAFHFGAYLSLVVIFFFMVF
jgi:hypothetical protein